MARPPAKFRYKAYGLEVLSDFEIAEFEPGSSAPPDVRLVRSEESALLPSGKPPAFIFGADGASLVWPEVGAFRISAGCLIEVQPREGVRDDLLSLPLVGPVFAVLLHQRGELTLHGSSVEVGGRGVTFLGDKTAGKSTTAAVMVAAGHRLLTDDVVLVRPVGSHFDIAAAYPQLKLMNDAAASVRIEGAIDLQLPHPDFTKTRQRLTGFSNAPTPANVFYVLERAQEGAPPSVERLDAVESFTALLRFSYAARFGQNLIFGKAAAQHMRQCAKLASHASVRLLVAPFGLGRLDELRKLIECDVSDPV